jgi:serine O-acetyltransferase
MSAATISANEFAEELKKSREHHSLGIQLKKETQTYVENWLSVLFPHFCAEQYSSAEEIQLRLSMLEQNLKHLLLPLAAESELNVNGIAAQVMQAQPEIHRMLWLDAQAITSGDPAAESVDEVILAYPGFLAIAIFRLAHEFYKLHVPIFPRLLTEYAHEKTSIDIHPGATIGESFAIDHGTGIVIGESTNIGANVKLYQGVTLGALSVDKKLAKSKRHPTIEDNVVIYAHAVILGGETVVGHHSIIGGNVWLTHSVTPYSIVYHDQEVKVQNQLDRSNLIDWVI